MKSREKAWTDLSSGFVFSPSLSLTWIQFVLSVQFVLRIQLLLDRSWLATVRDVSSGTHHMINQSRPSPRFLYCKQQKLGVEAWERGYQLTTLRVVIPTKSLLVQRQSPISHSYTVDDQRLQNTVQIWAHKSYGKSYQHPRFLTTAHASHVKSQDGEDPAHWTRRLSRMVWSKSHSVHSNYVGLDHYIHRCTS